KAFPTGFQWAISTESFKVEGAWEAEGKGLSIWDKFTHTPGKISEHDTGDVACNSYNKMEDDIAALKTVKVSHYRFSISWPRILPDGTTKNINQAAYLLDDVNVIGYTAWSLLDNLEWAVGYTERFGLFYVNRSDPDLPRTPKASVSFYSSIISCNGRAHLLLGAFRR
uniref:Lactase n=1 Tax=Poecilia reticulata TaxID=8081 RepID=A0A3P9PMB2_POERE